MNSSERKKRSRRSGCSRNRRSAIGGAYTAAYTFSGPISPEAYYANQVDPITSCGSPALPKLNTGPGGLPGMSGGKRRRSRKQRRNNTSGSPLSLNVTGIYSNQPGAPNQNRLPVANNEALAPINNKMVGGRWGFEHPQVVGEAGIALSGRDHVACEASRHNPLNEGVATPVTLPPEPQRGGVGGPDSMFYNAPTAGYTNVASDRLGGASGVLADGKTPFLVQVPYEAKTFNQACVKTGGGRRRAARKSCRRSTRKSRKSRKSRRRSN